MDENSEVGALIMISQVGIFNAVLLIFVIGIPLGRQFNLILQKKS